MGRDYPPPDRVEEPSPSTTTTTTTREEDLRLLLPPGKELPPPSVLEAVHSKGDDEILIWDFIVKRFCQGGSRNGNDDEFWSSLQCWDAPVQYMVVTNGGFYAPGLYPNLPDSPDFEFRWKDQFHGPNNFNGYVGRRCVNGSTDECAISHLKFLRKSWSTSDDEDDGSGSESGSESCSATIFEGTDVVLNKAFHTAIEEQLSKQT